MLTNTLSARIAQGQKMKKSPIENYDTQDPGDEMQRRIRYQHGYGIVLFCAAVNGSIELKSLWFEQKEDIILEKDNSYFVFYQVKTRDKTLGKQCENKGKGSVFKPNKFL